MTWFIKGDEHIQPRSKDYAEAMHQSYLKESEDLSFKCSLEVHLKSAVNFMI